MTLYLSLISAFQNSQTFMLNPRTAMLTCDNKLSSTLLFEKFSIPTPRTAFVSNEKNLKTALDMIGKVSSYLKNTNWYTRCRCY